MPQNKNITLTLRVSPDRAIQILNRLFGSGELSKEKYLERIREIDSVAAELEEKKQKNLKRILENPRVFYQTIKK